MSAFVCSREHILAVAAAAEWPQGLKAAYDTLLAANVRSVCTRYDDERPENYDYLRWEDSAEPPPAKAAVEVIKLAESLQYQSCEYSAYVGSDAEEIAAKAIRRACKRLPGYAEAAWAL